MSNPILDESVQSVRDLLGSELDGVTVERAALGLFFSGVKLSSGEAGVCFTPIKEIPEAVCCPSSGNAMPLSGRLSGRSASAYLDDVSSDNALKKTLGIATLNALSLRLAQAGLAPQFEIGGDAFDEVEIAPGDKAVVIGALVPALKRFARLGVDYTVLEMDSRTLKGDELNHFATADRYPEFLPHADVVIITGVTLINDTLPELLSHLKPGAKVSLAGPTVSMLPQPLFRRGVTMVGGIVVTDPDRCLDLLSEGGSGYHLFGKCAEKTLVRRGERPGLVPRQDPSHASV